MKSVGFVSRPLENYIWQLKVKHKQDRFTEVFDDVAALDRDITDVFIRDVKWAMRNEQHIIYHIYGQTGSGKSMLGLRILQQTHELRELPLDITENCLFDSSQLLMRIIKLPDRASVQLDETIEEFGEGSGWAKGQVCNLLETLREKGINFVLVRPTFAKKFAKSCHYLLQTVDWGIDEKRKYTNETRCLLRTKDCVPIGSVVISFPKPELISKYKVMKTESVRRLQQMEINRGQLIKGYVEKLLKDTLFLEAKNSKERIAVAKLKGWNITTGMLNTVATVAGIELREMNKK